MEVGIDSFAPADAQEGMTGALASSLTLRNLIAQIQHADEAGLDIFGGNAAWPPITRAQFDAVRTPRGALLVGNPEEVAEKILRRCQATARETHERHRFDRRARPAKIAKRINYEAILRFVANLMGG